MSNWTLEGGTKEIWAALKGVALVGHDRSPEYGNNLGPIVEVLLPAWVARVFGAANPDFDGLSWWWRREDGLDLSEAALQALSKVSLLSTVFPASVPLREAQNLIGKEITREGLAVRGFLVPIDTAACATPIQVEAELPTMTIDQVAEALQISRAAAYKRLQRGVIPGRMPGGKIRISRDKFMAWARSGGLR